MAKRQVERSEFYWWDRLPVVHRAIEGLVNPSRMKTRQSLRCCRSAGSAHSRAEAMLALRAGIA